MQPDMRYATKRIVIILLIAIYAFPLAGFATSQAQQSVAPGNAQHVLRQDAAIYAEPVSEAVPIHQLTEGTPIQIVGTVTDNKGVIWYVLLYNNGAAYIRAEDVILASEKNNATASPSPDPVSWSIITPGLTTNPPETPLTREMSLQTPSLAASQLPTATPTPVETAANPTASPSTEESNKPLMMAALGPRATATAEASASLAASPTATPTASPTATPTVSPTATPTAIPTATPTASPTATPTASPTATPTASPTATPTPVPQTPEQLPLELARLIQADATPAPGDEPEAPTAETFDSFYDAVPSGYLSTFTGYGNTDGSVFLAGNTLSPYYTDYHFPSVYTLQGIFSTISMYVTPPDYCDVQSATLLVSYTCSDLILTELSSLTFYLNNIPFYSCPLLRYNTHETVLYVDVPLSLFKEEFNLLEIRGYVRLTDDEGCMDEYAGANWININEATCLRLGFDIVEERDLLSLYPYPFISLLDKTGEGLSVAVSDKLDEKELEAALHTLADLGKEVPDINDIVLTRYSNAVDDKIIYFGLVENTPQELLSLLDSPVPQDAAVLKRVVESDHELLLVIANDGNALIDAARLLADGSRILQVESTEHIITLGETELLIQNMQLSGTVVEGIWTVKEFTGGGVPFVGPFRQAAVINLPVPKDYALGADGKFTLYMRYSENLDFDRSLMTLYWNDTPLASKKLTKEGSLGDTLVATVPADLVGANGSSITVAFDLEVVDMVCTPRQMEMPWAYITADSTVYLPVGSAGEYNLAYLPSPFQLDGRLNDLMVVTSDNPNALELVALGRVISMVGSGCSAYGSLRVVRSSDFDPADSDYNIITVGQPLQNTFLQRINDYLHFAYMPNYTAFASNAKLILTEDYAMQIGTIQLLHSPFNSTRAMLVVTSVADTGMQQLIRLASTEQLRWSLDSDTLVIDQNSKISTYQTYYEASTQDMKPNIFQLITQNREPLIFTIVATSAMLVLLAAVIMVLIRIHVRRKRD